MIDLAIIAAVPHLDPISASGSIDMALTHLVLRHPAYERFYRDRSLAGVTVFLDNSAYELAHTGGGLAARPVLDAASRIGATVLVCQDFPFDGRATVTSTRRFVAEALDRDSRPRPLLMGVPQGTTRQEWLDCYHRLVDLPGIDLIGLSKLSVPVCFAAPVAESRLACVEHLLDHAAPPPLHLLGGDRSLPWELSEHRRRGHDAAVRSNDSSFAYWYAVEGIDVDPCTGRADREAATRPDLESTRLGDDGIRTARRHVARLRQAAGLPPHPAAARRT
ncbi:hypothetical protein ACQPYE_21530 [Actinosynnema sp. CA-299493]